jgi:hypothetical protein
MIEKMKAHSGSEIFLKPPSPDHPNYAELMTDYIDLKIIENKLLDG